MAQSFAKLAVLPERHMRAIYATSFVVCRIGTQSHVPVSQAARASRVAVTGVTGTGAVLGVRLQQKSGGVMGRAPFKCGRRNARASIS